MVAEVGAERDLVDIHEDRILAIVARQPVEDAAGDRGGIRAARGEVRVTEKLPSSGVDTVNPRPDDRVVTDPA